MKRRVADNESRIWSNRATTNGVFSVHNIILYSINVLLLRANRDECLSSPLGIEFKAKRTLS